MSAAPPPPPLHAPSAAGPTAPASPSEPTPSVPPNPPSPGWYPDPWEQHEHRYFNGVAWTADVANGATMHVDRSKTSLPPPTARTSAPGSLPVRTGPPPFLPPHLRRRGLPPAPELALGGMLGMIVAALIGAVPYLAFVAIALIVASVAAAWLAHRRDPTHRDVRQRRTWTLIALPVALALTAVGTVLTFDALHKHTPPAPSAQITECRIADGTAYVRGTVTNRSSARGRLMITVSVSTSRDEVAVLRLETDDVAGGAEASFSGSVHSLAISPTCTVLDVAGPRSGD